MFVSRKIALVAVLALGAGAAGAQVLGGPLAARLSARQQAFVASLELNGAQQQAFAQLKGRELAFRSAARADVGTLASRVKSDLADPRADLHATVAMIQSDVDRLIARHREVTAAKLAFYDQLDARQQQKVREALLARIERLERVRDALIDLAEAAQ